MKPSIGRIVHYITPHGVHLPAMIISIPHDDTVALHVFQHPEVAVQLGQQGHVMHDKYGVCPGSWHWPEREEATA